MADRRNQAVVMASIGVERPIETDGLVDFAVVIVVWLLRFDHCAVAAAVIAVAERTIAVSLTLEGFHDLYDIPICIKMI